MRQWPRSEQLAVVGLLIGGIGTVATVAALWGPIFGPDPASSSPSGSRGLFRMPDIEWKETQGFASDQPPLQVAYTPDGEVLGFRRILEHDDEAYAACGGGSQIVTIHDVSYVPNTNIPTGFIGENAAGDRIVFEVTSRIGDRMTRVEQSFIQTIFRDKRRVFVTYVMCGTAMVAEIDQIVAE